MAEILVGFFAVCIGQLSYSSIELVCFHHTVVDAAVRADYCYQKHINISAFLLCTTLHIYLSVSTSLFLLLLFIIRLYRQHIHSSTGARGRTIHRRAIIIVFGATCTACYYTSGFLLFSFSA